MQVSVLGPVEVSRDGVPVTVGGARVRALLTRLALARGRPVPSAELIDAVWGGADSDDPANALQSLVSRLRRALGDPSAVVQVPGGYRLAVAATDVDVDRFERLVRTGRAELRAGRFDQAERDLGEALRLWHGVALADLPGHPAGTALDELRQAAVEDRLEADIRRGRAGEAATELEVLVTASPLRERATALLMDALVAEGRGAEALAAYERTRGVLADELGADPGTALSERHLRILRAEPVAAVESKPARSNLRTALTSFVGRESDLAAIADRVGANRLVTLVGPGGAGKTRLAVAAGAALTDRLRDGVWLVELAAVTDPADVLGAIVGTLGVREAALFDTRAVAGRRGTLERLQDAMAERELLLILDNCEHVLDAVAELVEHLLTRCPGLRILTTSRESLTLQGESLYPVPPLGHQAGGSAVQLFLDRARAIRPVGEADLATVEEICRRLDGLPLALELAAARTRALTVRQVADRLNDRFRLLSGGNRTAVARHRTLRAVVEWSWDLLTTDERWLLEQLSVFAGGVTVESADAVWAAAGRSGDTLDLLAALVDKSLLQPMTASEPRYRLLETIREFGIDQLAARGELGAARAAHAEHFREWAVRAEPLIRTSEQLEWIRRFGDERDNLFGAIQHLVDTADADAAVQLTVALGWFWTVRGEHDVASTWLGVALDVPGATTSAERAAAAALRTINRGDWFDDNAELTADIAGLAPYADPERYPVVVVLRAVGLVFADDPAGADDYIAGMLERAHGWCRAGLYMVRALMTENNGDVNGTRECLVVALPAFRRLGDRFGLINCLGLHARIATLDGDLEGARTALRQAAAVARELGAYDDAGQSMCSSALTEVRLGRLDDARAAVRIAEADFARVGSFFGAVFLDSVDATLDALAGDLELARSRIARARGRLAAESRSFPPQITALLVMGAADVELLAGDLDRAAGLTDEAVRTAVLSRDLPMIALAAVLTAKLTWHRGDRELAAELLGASDGLRGAPDPTDPDVVPLERELRAALGDDEFTRRRDHGRRLDRDDAMARVTTAAGRQWSRDGGAGTPDSPEIPGGPGGRSTSAP